MKKRILIVDKMHESIEPMLEEKGFEVDFKPDIQPEEVANHIAAYHGLILRSKIKVTRQLIEGAPMLEFIARAGAGVDQIEEDYLRERKITLLNAPEGNRDALAEHTLGLTLCLLNHIHLAHQQITRGIWDREGNRGREIAGKTFTLYGFGNMGQATAARLQGFSARVLAYDKYRSDITTSLARLVDKEQVFRDTDILSLHVPLTPETKGFFNLSFFQRFDKPIYLINTARGEILPLEDLLLAIRQGIVKGAALDVLENEKLHTLSTQQKETMEALAATGKVLFTPHVGGWSVESYQKINLVLANKIERLYQNVD